MVVGGSHCWVRSLQCVRIALFTAVRFQEELLRTMMQIESVFFRLAETVNQNVLIICDRGSMDASACEFNN
jgi:hypothetical protein